MTSRVPVELTPELRYCAFVALRTTLKEAVRALHRITTIRRRALDSGLSSEQITRREVRDHRCPACGGPHLTSQA